MSKDKGFFIRPCPFCNSKKVRVMHGTFSVYVQCSKCKVTSTLFENERLAAEWWNKRYFG